MYNAVIGIQTVRVLRIKFVLEERFLDDARNDAGGLDSSIIAFRMTFMVQNDIYGSSGLDFSTALEMTFINQYDIMNRDDTNYLDSRL